MAEGKTLIVDVNGATRELVLIPVISIQNEQRVPVYWGYVCTPHLMLHLHSLLVRSLNVGIDTLSRSTTRS